MPTILLVDDERAVRRVVASMLRAADFEVIESGSGEEAVQIAGDTEFDLLLTDLRLPDFDGRALATRLRPRHVLYISGDSFGSASPMITKPFSSRDLVNGVRQALGIATEDE